MPINLIKLISELIENLIQKLMKKVEKLINRLKQNRRIATRNRIICRELPSAAARKSKGKRQKAKGKRQKAKGKSMIE